MHLIEAGWLRSALKFIKFGTDFIADAFLGLNAHHQAVAAHPQWIQHEDVKTLEPNQLTGPAGRQFAGLRREPEHISVLENRCRANVPALRPIGRWVSCLFERASVNFKYTADWTAIIDGKALGKLFKPGRPAKFARN